MGGVPPPRAPGRRRSGRRGRRRYVRGDIHSIVVNLGIIGGGRAAWAFGSTWRRLGWPIAGVTLRDTAGGTPCAPTDASVGAGRGGHAAAPPLFPPRHRPRSPAHPPRAAGRV